eukprot:GHVU01075401.1.p3 GENE.GHVU01075401.1~~GHVU01075401.1.p3  ORF type:complete len:135 (-),score=14.57 GHVU01075401.1:2664-3068(-)
MAKCKGTTKSGECCKRNATTGDYCKTHSQDKGNTIDNGNDSRDSPSKVILEFVNIAQRCNDKLEETEQPGVQVQWMKMILDCCRFAKEEQRLLDGLGAGTTHNITINAPSDKPRPPADSGDVVKGDAKDTGLSN